MNKDIIYIDTEDDITSIIGKIKSSNDKIVVLVPPKRIGVLQSAVNLQLLARTAKINEKHLVVITNNKALIALSASAKIPVAKNLQSKPEIAEIAALDIDDGDDIIEGKQLPVGDFVKVNNGSNSSKDLAGAISTIDIDDEGPEAVILESDDQKGARFAKPVSKSNVKVPDFSKFRKKLFLGITGGALLIIFLVWAIWFAPAATIVITTKTEPAPVSTTLKLVGAEPTNIDKLQAQTITKEIKKDVSVEFTATGKDQVGTKAKGQVAFQNCETDYSQNIPAGTAITNNGSSYVTDSTVSVPAGAGGFLGCSSPGVSVPVSVTAVKVGSSFNKNSGVAFTVGNHVNSSNAYFRAVATTDLTGGESHEATVVTQEDILKAGEALVDLPSNDIKQQLIKQFANGEKVILDSYNIERTDAVSVPKIGAEAVDGKAKLTSASTFTIAAIAKSELQAFLKNSINKQLNDDATQRVYDDGYDKLSFSGYSKTESGATVNITTIGKIGPNIKQESIKEQVAGKQFGDAQSIIERIKGVNSVDIKFSYFWVNTIPGDVKKIDVEFVLKDV